VVLPGVTGSAVVVTVGEEGGDHLPLGAGEVVTTHGWSPLEEPPISRDEFTGIIDEKRIVRNDLTRFEFARVEPVGRAIGCSVGSSGELRTNEAR
jgi:hypothetical protein